MDIVFAASEMFPFAKAGGLGDVMGSLPREVARRGHRVYVFLPKYKWIAKQKFGLSKELEGIVIPMGSEQETANIFSCAWNEVTVYLVDHLEYFGRDYIYGTPLGDYPDNDRRFTFFQRVVLEAMKRLRIEPDVLHAHDWQAGLLPAYLKTLYRSDPNFKKTKSMFTIHNLAYQGNFPPDSLSITGFSWDEFHYDKLEFYGKVSFMKAGLVYSDVITTVSERYAREIQTKEFGAGLEKALEIRAADIHGIVNGINPEDWDPEKDKALSKNFSKQNLSGKEACKEALQKHQRFKVNPHVPLFGFVGRLVTQKGLNLLIEVIEDMMKLSWQLVVLGTGEEKFHSALRILAARHPGQLGINITYDEKLAKEVYAGSDIFLMPSQFEPCGLGQLIAMRFGTVPLVRDVGGLADTVSEFELESGKGNGFKFSRYKSSDFLKTMNHAVEVYENRKKWLRLVKNCMESDFSWKESARRYVALYERAERKALKS